MKVLAIGDFHGKFPTGHITKEITVKRLSNLLKNENNILEKILSAPKLIKDEIKLLELLGIKTRIWFRSLSITHLGNFSLCCDIFISRKSDLIKFYKEVGFSIKGKKEKLARIIKNIGGGNDIKTL